MIKRVVGTVIDFVALVGGVLVARYLTHLSSPARDWQEVKSVYRHVRSSWDFFLLKLHLPTRAFSLLRLDRVLQLRMKVYFANGGYADDR